MRLNRELKGVRDDARFNQDSAFAHRRVSYRRVRRIFRWRRRLLFLSVLAPSPRHRPPRSLESRRRSLISRRS